MASPTVIDAAWTFDDQNTAQNGRFVIGGLFQNSAAATAANATWRDGVIPGTWSTTLSKYRSLHVTQSAVPGSSVLVQPGHAVVTRTGQGLYVCPNSSARTVALDAANATNPRIDLIVLKVLDTALGDGSTQVQVLAVTGTPSGSPVAPALPTGAIPLAQVAVAAAPTGNTIVDANITDLRKSAALTGAVRPLLPGDSVSDAAQEGDLRYNNSNVERYSAGGNRWDPLARIFQGWGYVSELKFNGPGVSSGATDTLMLSHTFAAQANRKYKVSARIGLGVAASSNIRMRLVWTAGNSTSTGGSQFATKEQWLATTFVNQEAIAFGTFNGPATAGNVTVGICIQNLSGAIATDNYVSSTNQTYILVEDVAGV